MKSNRLKAKAQFSGRFLSAMVIPNIGAFIAWGLLTAIFIPSGWYPNENIANLIDPMVIYLLPILIGYTGGKIVAGDRGGVIGAISTVGVISSAAIPMFLGAMIIGPLSALVIKYFDRLVHNRIKPGFEMIVNNFHESFRYKT